MVNSQSNRAIVLEFYELGLIQKRLAEAFERYVAEGFVEHKPDVEGGDRDGTLAVLTALTEALPNCRWELVRTIAEKDHVFLHAKFFPSPEAPPYAVGDIFRLTNGKIVEHWDIVAPPNPTAKNPNDRF
jgi:predicted SnoaL-like aldol condensation-catalyzing enzyme